MQLVRQQQSGGESGHIPPTHPLFRDIILYLSSLICCQYYWTSKTSLIFLFYGVQWATIYGGDLETLKHGHYQEINI